MQVKNRMKVIYERHGATKLRIILPSVVQIPLFILVSLALRAMSGWTGWYDVGMTAPMEPLLRAEGFGAIQDLTRPDGSYVLPVLIGLMGITNVEVTQKLAGNVLIVVDSR
jgi:membrane protein insertase Oxa1/YidC/SpoIIIJ